MKTMAVFQKVSSGALTPEDGADILLAPRGQMLSRPSWMPRWAYVASVVVIAALFAPILGSRNRQSQT